MCCTENRNAENIATGPVHAGASEEGNTFTEGPGEYKINVFRTDTVEGVGMQGFGYDIYLGDKLVIRQPHIPAVPGLKPFRNISDAEKVGTLVVYKLRKNIMPPSVSVNELDSLEIEL